MSLRDGPSANPCARVREPGNDGSRARAVNERACFRRHCGSTLSDHAPWKHLELLCRCPIGRCRPAIAKVFEGPSATTLGIHLWCGGRCPHEHGLSSRVRPGWATLLYGSEHSSGMYCAVRVNSQRECDGAVQCDRCSVVVLVHTLLFQ
jgi:hypothetical protein